MIVLHSFCAGHLCRSRAHTWSQFFSYADIEISMPDLGYLEGPPNLRRGGRVLLVPISTPKGPSLLLPAPLYVAVVLYAPLVLAAGVSQSSGYLGVTAKERKIELLMHMLSIKHETNLLL